jgi:methionine-rich copper-binding protein CopC
MPAHGHAIVLESSPKHDATLARPPERIVLRFNSKIEKRLTRVTLTAGDGAAVPMPIATEGAGAGAQDRLVIPLRPLGPGVYVLRYRVLAADGHITEGALRFTVGAGQ